MIWLLCNDLNYDAAKATHLNIRFPFFELDSFVPADGDASTDSVLIKLKQILPPAPKLLAEMTSQRLIKTHFPIKLMPHDVLAKGCKIVYVARCPRDVLVSLFHFSKVAGYSYVGNFEEFVDFFMKDLLPWGPYFEHIKDAWNRRNDSNVLFLFYENLVVDLENSLKKLASFLERPLSDNELPELLQHLSFQNFKQNSSVNMQLFENLGMGGWSFMRRGQVGGNPEITAEIGEKIDAWTNEQLKGTGLIFPIQ
ncbi:hypothetical protein HA402_005002 [Bradysia odoriphaga]|nr:hypothetical protein HA402_005002 [Bradysia odoriphaga]